MTTHIENGPLWINKDGATLRKNPSSWNRVANVIYLESPAGVGFSTSNVTSDYTVGDARTAMDAYIFLVKWFAKFSQYQGRPFWVSGESYG
jgi:serine carboxypeptidase-like clade 2